MQRVRARIVQHESRMMGLFRKKEVQTLQQLLQRLQGLQ
jgi:hypothetical protein